jgi:DNA-binding response OmpR family regulator
VSPRTDAARRGFVLQVDLSEVADEDLDDLLRTVQNLADLAAEWFPNARARAALTGSEGSARVVPSGQAAAFRDRLRSLPNNPTLTIDPHARTVEADDRTIALTSTELALLVHLAQASPRVVTRSELLASVWGGRDVPDGSRTVDVHVRRLREKTGLADLLVTARGTGYRIAPRYDVRILG